MEMMIAGEIMIARLLSERPHVVWQLDGRKDNDGHSAGRSPGRRCASARLPSYTYRYVCTCNLGAINHSRPVSS